MASDGRADGVGSGSGSGEIATGWDASAVAGLASETGYWLADDEHQREDVTDKVWSFALATFVDGVAITPQGYDDSHLFDVEPEPRTDGGEPADGVERTRYAPSINDDGTMTLHGVGPECPGCGGPTHAVTADEGAERPWWCQRCNVRLDDQGNAGSQADFPSGADPDGATEGTEGNRDVE